MTEKDVMVGDWFRFRYTTISNREVVHTFRISQIENQLGQYYVWGDGFGRMCHPENLEPIPLTPKILGKNGFTRPNDRVRYFTESTDYYDVDIHEITDSIWCFEYQNCEAHFPPCLILIAHVHELQHALRLCGISKDITL